MKIVIFQKKMSPLPFIYPLKKNGKFTKILLEHNANPNLVNKSYSQTPMHLAIINKANERILLSFKNYNEDFFYIKDKYEKTPFDYAKELNDEKYLVIVKKIFEIKEKVNYSKNKEKENKYENEKNIDINNNFLENNNERILNLNKLLQKIDISLNNKENKNEKNHEIKELKEDYKD